MNTPLEFFFRQIYLAIFIPVSFVVNLINIQIYSKKRFNQVPSRNFLILLSIGNLFSIPNIVFIYIHQVWKYDLSATSNISCKVIMFTYYTISPILAYILVLISLENYYSLKSSKRFLRLKQIFVTCFTIGFNIIYYSPYLFLYSVQTSQIPVSGYNKTSSK